MLAIELFAGAGGLGMGVSRAGFTPVLIVERDRWCCDTLRENRTIDGSPIKGWPRPLETDVRLVDYTPYEGKVHIVTGGPPCQPFSLGGRHKASDDHRDMWSEAVRAILETRPPAFIFENVKGLARQSFSDYLGYIILQLQYPSLKKSKSHTWTDHLARLQKHHTGRGELEYRVVHKLLNAANYGVPQRRERVVFVGFRSDIEAKWTFPAETHSLDALLLEQFRTGEYWDRHKVAAKHRCFTERLSDRSRRITERPSRQPWRTVRDALVGLPDPECDPLNSQSFHNHRFQPGARSYLGHTGSPLDEPAKTLKAGVHGVPGGENMLRLANGHTRYFTVRESARLQTFPDNYALHGVWSEAMRQIGNAVPVTLAEVIAKSVRQHLRAHIDR